MISLYLGGEAKQWFEDNKDSLHNIKLLELGLIQRYGTDILSKITKEMLAKFINNPYHPPVMKSVPVTATKPMFTTLPSTMVYKIKERPPQAEISDAFFKLCVVAACTKRDVLMAYKADKIGENVLLDKYLNDNFARNGIINFNSMNLIGNILLCYLPSSYCEFILPYREKLKAGSIFDSDIEYSELSDMQKTILKDKLRVFNMENSKVCGYIMNTFMVRCEKSLPLPSIDFLNWNTTTLTTEEKRILDNF